MKLINTLAFVTLVALASCGNGATDQQSPSQSATDSTAQTETKKSPITGTVTIAMNGDMMLGSIKPNRLLPDNDGKDLLRHQWL